MLFIGGGDFLLYPLWTYEDKVDVIAPINMLFIGGGEFGFIMKIKLMLLRQATSCS